MNSDIRIAVSFKDHRKRKRLRMMVGDRATDYLLDLWISTALNHPSGYLKGMDTLDIALDAGYDGTDPDGFVKALVACGLIEYIEEKSCYHVHDWETHQVYAIHAEARSAQASKAANSRWASKNAVAASPPTTTPASEEQQPDAQNAAGMLTASKTDAHSISQGIDVTPPPTTEPASEEQQTDAQNAAGMLTALLRASK